MTTGFLSGLAGLALEERLKDAQVSPRCGLLVIELKSGDVIEWLRLEEPVRELYDVLALPGVRRPRLVGFKTDEIRTRVWADPTGLEKLNRTNAPWLASLDRESIRP